MTTRAETAGPGEAVIRPWWFAGILYAVCARGAAGNRVWLPIRREPYQAPADRTPAYQT